MSLSKAGLVSPIPVTLAQRDAITDKQPGYIVYNTDEQEAEMWTGTEWIILGSRPGVLNYRGGIDMTTSAPTYQPPENGDMYLNEKEGVVTAGWENLTGLGVLPNDRVVFDGTNWALITSGGGIPNLQVVTDAGDTTTHTITTAGYITAGNVQATDGLFSGNVGIGDSNPSQKLTVRSDTSQIRISRTGDNTEQYLDLYAAGGYSFLTSKDNDEAAGFVFRGRNSIDYLEYMRISNDGRVGIGTNSPTSLLHLASNAPYINFEDTDNNQDWQLQATTWFALRNASNNTEMLRVTADGKVGIGTDSPAVKVERYWRGSNNNCSRHSKAVCQHYR